MKILGVQMQDKTALIIGAVGLVLAYSAYKKTSDAVGATAEYLKQNFSNPVDALLANIGILPDSATHSTTTPTKAFSEYIQSMGGIDEYIRQNKNGTFTGAPFGESKAVVAPSWYDVLGNYKTGKPIFTL